MNNIGITSPYAHDLILEALDICIAAYPTAIELKPIESLQVSGGFMLEEHRLYYNPVVVLNQTFNDLCDNVHNVFIHYYLRKVPRCTLQPIFNNHIH